ncbi:MAG: DUF4131 domain-containing protein [Betaproteobacteria bacterium]|nr:DUF4131 domain-containing protein [Betaproteobacteria bacterium]
MLSLVLLRQVPARIGKAGRFTIVAIAFAALGVAWATWRAEIRLAGPLPRDWESRDIEVMGAIASMPQVNDRGARFEFEVEKISPLTQ